MIIINMEAFITLTLSSALTLLTPSPGRGASAETRAREGPDPGRIFSLPSCLVRMPLGFQPARYFSCISHKPTLRVTARGEKGWKTSPRTPATPLRGLPVLRPRGGGFLPWTFTAGPPLHRQWRCSLLRNAQTGFKSGLSRSPDSTFGTRRPLGDPTRHGFPPLLPGEGDRG